MNTHEARAKMDSMTPRGMLMVRRRHYNGTCACYVPEGTGINGTKNSGKNCTWACLSGGYQAHYENRINWYQRRG